MPVREILKQNEVNSSPKRRSIMPPFASTPYIANDDEVERHRRRTNSEIQRRISNIGITTSVVDNSSSDVEKVELNASKLQDHYQTCVKLFTENKLNAKNAWNVHIVEYMKVMLKKGLVMKDTLRQATTSIDIGCKVYCLKVDQVHNDLFKLASAMVKVDIEENGNEDQDNNDDEEFVGEEADAKKKKEKKKKRVRQSLENEDYESTVAKEEESLNGIILPHNTAVQQVSSGKNRLYTLSMISKQKWGFEQMVNCRSNFPYFTSLDSPENIKISREKVNVTIPSPKSRLCPSFIDFVINIWQPDDDDVPMGTQPAVNLSQNNLVYDDNGLPIPDLDASVHDSGDAHFDDVDEVVETAIGHEFQRPVAFITEMRPGQGPLSDVPLQYSYRSAPVISERYMLSGVWAGPSHWKIKSLQRRTTTADTASVNAAPQRARRQRKSEPDIIAFDQDVDEEEMLSVNNKKKKKIRRGSISKVTLPEDLGITIDSMCTLQINPARRINIENSAAESSHVNLNMTGNYKYDNPDDADYCSQTLHDPDINDDNDNDCNDILQQTLTDDNMVAAPSQVQKFHVPYATQAKRMDMRKLKDAIWKTMAVTETGDDQIVEDKEKLKSLELKKVPFSKLYKSLPLYITSRMAEDLSAPLAFVALLHLANEETLSIEGITELTDALISTNK